MNASWMVWIGRLAFSLLATAVVAWGVSFKVADYILDKHITDSASSLQVIQQSIQTSNDALAISIQTSFTGLQGSIESLTDAVQGLTERINGVNVTVSEVSDQSTATATEVVSLRRDVEFIRLQVDRLATTTPAVFYSEVYSHNGVRELEAVDPELIRSVLERSGWATRDPIIFNVSRPDPNALSE